MSRVADLHAIEISPVGGQEGYVIPEISVVTIYALMGQLLSSVVKTLILKTFNPVANPYAIGSADSVPGGVITTAVEHGTRIVPLKVSVKLLSVSITY